MFISFVADSFSDKLTCENKLEDAVYLGEFLNIWVDIYVDEQSLDKPFKEKVEKLITLLTEINVIGAYSVAHIKQGKFDKINRKNYKNYVKKFTKKFDEICFEVLSGRIPVDD